MELSTASHEERQLQEQQQPRVITDCSTVASYATAKEAETEEINNVVQQQQQQQRGHEGEADTTTVIPSPRGKPSAATSLTLAVLANAAAAAPRATAGTNAVAVEAGSVAAVDDDTKNESKKIPPKQLFVLIRILFQYLEKVDAETLQLARKVRETICV